MKRILAVLLCVLMTLSVFVSCTKEPPIANDVNDGDLVLQEATDDEVKQETKELTAEEVLAEITKALDTVSDVAIDANMALTMTMLGETIDMDMVMTSEASADVMHVVMDMQIPALEQSTVTETYVDISVNPAVQYVQTEDIWYKQELDEHYTELYSSGNAGMDMSVYSEYMTDAVVTLKEYNGKECYEVSGAVDIDYMEFLENMNLDSIIGDLDEAGLPENFFEELFKDIDPFVLVMAVDKETFLPVYCSIDMTLMMDTLMSAIMDMTLAQYGEEAAGMEIGIPNCFLECFYREYGKIDVEIPAEVLENAVDVESLY